MLILTILAAAASVAVACYLLTRISGKQVAPSLSEAERIEVAKYRAMRAMQAETLLTMEQLRRLSGCSRDYLN